MKFFKNNIKDSVVTNFIERVCIDFELELERTVTELGENPLCYQEKTMSSFLFPALQQNSIRTLMEVYYNNGQTNFLDFYSLDKTRKCSYLIEFKHRFWGNTQKDFLKNDIAKWHQVNEQIGKLDKKAINEYLDSDKNIYGLSLYMLTVTVPKEETDNNKIEKYIISKIEENMSDYNWGWVYELPEALNYTNNNESDNEVDKYSHVIFIGKVTKLDEK